MRFLFRMRAWLYQMLDRFQLILANLTLVLLSEKPSVRRSMELPCVRVMKERLLLVRSVCPRRRVKMVTVLAAQYL
jgi:hypothetical protein